MTKWAGETMFTNLGAKTSLLVIESPYVAGQPAAQLAAGDKIGIRLGGPNTPWVNATVDSADPTEAHLVLQDGTILRMTPWQQGDFPVGVTWSGGPSQEWVIRDVTAASQPQKSP